MPKFSSACFLTLLAVFTWQTDPVFASDKTVLALEREMLSQDCAEIEFMDGYIKRVDANGDKLPDYLINTQNLLCDGSQMMWCGTMGCAHRIWLGERGGGFTLALDTYAYEIVFDRPEDTSFLVATRNGSERQNLADEKQSGGHADHDRAGSLTVPSAVPIEQWAYFSNPVPAAAVASDQNGRLLIACDNGSARIGYTVHWMFENGEIQEYIREWDASGIVATFDTAGQEIDVPMRLSEADGLLVAKDTISFGAPLLDALALGRRVTVHHGGSLEHELNYSLSGSGQAIASLRSSCT